MGLGWARRIGACWMRLRGAREPSFIIPPEPKAARSIAKGARQRGRYITRRGESITAAKWSKERTLLWQKRG